MTTETLKPRVGLLALSLELYEQLAPALRENRERWVRQTVLPARHLALFTKAGLPVERLVMCGPAAGSRVTPGIVANATDRPVTCVGQSAVSAFGAATIARAVVEGPASLARLARDLAPAMWSVEPG